VFVPPKLSSLLLGALVAIAPRLCLAADGSAASASATPPGHVTGIGGIFTKSRDPKALAAWYRDVLGMPLEKCGGAMLRYDAPGHPTVMVWNAFPQSTDYMAPSEREFMVNFAVDDLDAIIARMESKGVSILKRDDSSPTGRFAWLLDPDGTKIELWQPK
jgi:predicted enzyme related to lactoylglutathione lyase